MNYCSRCCQPDTRPKLIFKDGVCGACLWEEERKKIDWNIRMEHLRMLVDWAKVEGKKRGTYDCVLGVSGGKDSTFTALYAKEKLGLNCLLVSAVPDMLTQIGRHNFDNLIRQGFDCIRIYVNPTLLRQLMRKDFFDYLHFRKANEYPLWASTYRVAKEKNIPLIIQGENAALTLGVSEGMNTDWDATTIYRTNTIAGATAVEHFSDFPANQLYSYTFPDLSNWDGKALWINYFLKEWSPEHNALFGKERGMRWRDSKVDGYIHPWSSLDSPFHVVSQMHKYYKFGFGFVTDEVCYDIREGRMTRKEGFDLIEKYDGQCYWEDIWEFSDFIGITMKEHWETVNKFRRYDPWGRFPEQTEGIL
uniref:N-acetyl sugar amidotransferase n=1 Tax=viral metagenome TaxID=1070528 RepID=A0A6H1ZVQ5_9ZZZZ